MMQGAGGGFLRSMRSKEKVGEPSSHRRKEQTGIIDAESSSYGACAFIRNA